MRPSWIEVDLAAIRHNAAAIAAAVAPARLCAVVKADGYGHGDVPAAEAAVAGGATWLATALVEEGVRLREAGIETPILLLSEPPENVAAQIVAWRLTPTVYSAGLIDALEAAAGSAGASGYPVHLKVDTGMHRVGADPAEALELARRVLAAPHLALEGLWTHLAVAEEDPEFTKHQYGALAELRDRLGVDGVTVPILHAANTAGALGYADARFDMVRVGLGVYGLRPAPGLAPDVELRPAMRVVSRVSKVRRLAAGSRPSYGRRRPLPADAFVATVPIGYADGLSRRLGELGGEVLIRGRRRPFAGTVTMDHVMIDAGDGPVEVGDEVVLLGRQGDEEITADEWADRLGTISYEVVCVFGPRLPRRYAP
jgi:alanine racemase